MKAAEMLTPNDAIIIASGTTVLAFAAVYLRRLS